MTDLRRGDDGGFTLVELLMAVVITSIVTATIGAAMVVGLRTSGATAVRLEESHDAQLLSTYVIRDLQSVAETGVQASFPSPALRAASSCPAVAAEAGWTSVANLLRLSWSESTPAPLSFTVEYRRAYDPIQLKWQLLRKSCATGSPTTVQVVVHQLHATTLPAVDVSHLPSVSLRVTEPSGYAFSVAGSRRTPDSTPLPVAPWECTVLSAIGIPDPLTRTTVAPGPLAEDERIEVQTGGVCSALTLIVTPGLAAPLTLGLTQTPAGSGRYLATIPKAAYAWTDGDKAFPIREGGATLATLRLVVKQACIPSAFTVAPVTATRVEGASPGNLAGDLVLSATTSGVCLPLVAETSTNGGPALVIPLTETVPGSWTGTIAGGVATWTDGAHTLQLKETGVPAVLSTATVTVSPSCLLGTAVATPNPVKRTGPGQNQLEVDVSVTLNASGLCTGLGLQLETGAAGTTVAVPLTETAPGTWSGTISRTAGDWAAGTKTVRVVDAYGNSLGTFTFGVGN